jgi:predicted amidohydrolase YtcJ
MVCSVVHTQASADMYVDVLDLTFRPSCLPVCLFVTAPLPPPPISSNRTAIGDFAADVVLTAFERCQMGIADRPILTHCQVMRKELYSRMLATGTVANVQPQFVASDCRWASQRLHSSLLEESYPWHSMLECGIPVAGGSDAPIEIPNPLLGMYSAMYRLENNAPLNTDGSVPEGKQFRAQECLSRQQALDMYTIMGAVACGRTAQLGQLLPTFSADFTILEEDAWDNPALLRTAKVHQVWVDGTPRLPVSSSK